MSEANQLHEARGDAPLLLKAATVARRLEVGERTLWRWVGAGRFPPPDLRMGAKVVRWQASTVSDWVDAKSKGVRS